MQPSWRAVVHAGGASCSAPWRLRARRGAGVGVERVSTPTASITASTVSAAAFAPALTPTPIASTVASTVAATAVTSALTSTTITSTFAASAVSATTFATTTLATSTPLTATTVPATAVAVASATFAAALTTIPVPAALAATALTAPAITTAVLATAPEPSPFATVAVFTDRDDYGHCRRCAERLRGHNRYPVSRCVRSWCQRVTCYHLSPRRLGCHHRCDQRTLGHDSRRGLKPPFKQHGDGSQRVCRPGSHCPL